MKPDVAMAMRLLIGQVRDAIPFDLPPVRPAGSAGLYWRLQWLFAEAVGVSKALSFERALFHDG
jgi:hypothetical protein